MKLSFNPLSAQCRLNSLGATLCNLLISSRFVTGSHEVAQPLLQQATLEPDGEKPEGLKVKDIMKWSPISWL
jgi:hypothetical protein